jgi:hypothetical protein
MPIWGRDMIVAGGEQQTAIDVQTAQEEAQDTYLAGRVVKQDYREGKRGRAERPRKLQRATGRQRCKDECDGMSKLRPLASVRQWVLRDGVGQDGRPGPGMGGQQVTGESKKVVEKACAGSGSTSSEGETRWTA